MTLDPNDTQKILVVTLSNLGDVILTLPVFQGLVENFPKAQIHVMVSQSAKEVFDGDPRITKIITYDKKMGWRGKLALLRSVRQEKYLLIVEDRKSTRLNSSH